MKLHLSFEMDVDEEILRKELNTRNAEETAIVTRSHILCGIAEIIEDNNAISEESINLEVTVRE